MNLSWKFPMLQLETVYPMPEEHPFLANQSRHILAKTILDPELYLPEGSKVQLIVQDDLTPLVEFQIYVRGYRLQDPAP